MKVIQSKSFFEEKIGFETELSYNDIIFKYNPENIHVNDISFLRDNNLLIAKIRSYEDYGVSSYYFVEDNNVDQVFNFLKSIADNNTKPPHLIFELAVLPEYDANSIITNPANFTIEIYDPSSLLND
jgi:hypothetical protein